ncbi:MAG: acyclic terpene utilization AtuA family protein [Pseudomonadales bacterium]|nr:acyclic terpene utilization AtuA family protein [Halioglobus sp.]MCP5121007.1 acyclic terpene utilization AtuA family protein [Pseudomonadales bacterium]
MATFTILSPTAILGYGFPEASFERGLACNPDLIAVDAGSADPGPYYLGAGKSFTDRAAVRRDLGHLLPAAVKRGIPLVIGSAGGAGARPHLQWTVDIIEQLAQELGLAFRLGVIAADINPETLRAGLEQGGVQPLTGAPPLTAEAIDETAALVAQMGVEPLQNALATGCDVVVAGRAYDPAVFAALPILRGFDPGLALHLGKILECAAIAASPGSGADCALGILENDRFVLQALSDDRCFTPASVAAHTLYEKSNPCILPGPGGELDLREVHFEDIGRGRVAVSGSRFTASSDYCLKIEGARLVGYRCISIAGIRDPIMIASIGEILEQVRTRVDTLLPAAAQPGSLHFHVYGRDAVMGPGEPMRGHSAHELGVVIDAVCPTPEAADTLCSLTRSTLLHFGYPARIATAGNLAFPFSPSDLRAGAVYEFSVYHLLRADPLGLFPLTVRELGQ